MAGELANTDGSVTWNAADSGIESSRRAYIPKVY